MDRSSVTAKSSKDRWLMMAALLAGALPLIAAAQSGNEAPPQIPAAMLACSQLASVSLPAAKVVKAEEFGAGMFAPPPGTGPAEAGLYKALPAFCRVTIAATPSADSNIPIEVWMPESGWNGRFRGQGNGGFAGEINYALMALATSQGYATAGTDTGHKGDSTDATWSVGHPEKVIDFGYRAIHLMTTNAKTVIDAYYHKPVAHAYFASCSDGGREALMEAQRFPLDYDGILAGAPAYNWTNLVTNGVHKYQQMTRSSISYIKATQIPAISAAVNAACDAQDGVKDGVLNDPRQCSFKPESLLCKDGQSGDSCLNPDQVSTLKTLYGPTLDRAGKQVYPASLPGGEDGPGGWGTWVVGSEPGKSLGYAFGQNYFGYMVYGDPGWNYKIFNVDDGLKEARAKTAAALNATDPKLSAFQKHGGKLILYHGWNDPAISPLGTIEYYQQVQQANHDAAGFVDLFMVPGMQHCMGGPGATSFGQFGYRPGTGPEDARHDLSLGLEEWVEQGKKPQQVIAAKLEAKGDAAPIITMTRPLCTYPMVAQYKGSGDTSDAASFVCSAAK